MTKPMVRIHNLETNKIVDREMTDAELKQYNDDLAQIANQQTEAAEKAASRQAVLDRLGISAEEAQLLLGAN
jgi:hypothetical protein